MLTHRRMVPEARHHPIFVDSRLRLPNAVSFPSRLFFNRAVCEANCGGPIGFMVPFGAHSAQECGSIAGTSPDFVAGGRLQQWRGTVEVAGDCGSVRVSSLRCHSLLLIVNGVLFVIPTMRDENL